MTYPAVPGPRMAYDRDGSVPFWYDSAGIVTSFTGAQAVALNDESDTSWVDTGPGSNPSWIGVIFPELRDLAGWFICADDGVAAHAFGTIQWQTSPDSTSGLDGSWSAVRTDGTPVTGPGVVPAYRTTISAFSVPGIKAIKFTVPGFIGDKPNWYAMHLYGKPAAGQNPDSLRVYSGGAEVGGSYGDFANIPRLSVATKTFVIKNISATATSTGTIVSMEALTDATPSQIGQYELSTDGVTWATAVNVGTIGPGASSPTIYLRDTVAGSAQLDLACMRVIAVPTTYG